MQVALVVRYSLYLVTRPSASREADLRYATVRATRLTYVGELSWELCTPVEFAACL
jgi:glycine cleavage system aminomethyltransferase T